MSTPTAFQPSAFQNNAYQIDFSDVLVPVGSPSYERRFFTNLASGFDLAGDGAAPYATHSSSGRAIRSRGGGRPVTRPFRRSGGDTHKT